MVVVGSGRGWLLGSYGCGSRNFHFSQNNISFSSGGCWVLKTMLNTQNFGFMGLVGGGGCCLVGSGFYGLWVSGVVWWRRWVMVAVGCCG